MTLQQLRYVVTIAEIGTISKAAEELLLGAKNNKKVVAIGEIGLDYYDFEHQISEVKEKFPALSNLTKEEFIEKQKKYFCKAT